MKKGDTVYKIVAIPDGSVLVTECAYSEDMEQQVGKTVFTAEEGAVRAASGGLKPYTDGCSCCRS